MTTYAPGPYYLLDKLSAHKSAQLIIDDLAEFWDFRRGWVVVGVPCHKDIIGEELKAASGRLARKIAKIEKQILEHFGEELYRLGDIM